MDRTRLMEALDEIKDNMNSEAYRRLADAIGQLNAPEEARISSTFRSVRIEALHNRALVRLNATTADGPEREVWVGMTHGELIGFSAQMQHAIDECELTMSGQICAFCGRKCFPGTFKGWIRCQRCGTTCCCEICGNQQVCFVRDADVVPYDDHDWQPLSIE